MSLKNNKCLYKKMNDLKRVIKLFVNMDEEKLKKIIRNILLEFCNPTIIGYINSNDTYWMKSNTYSLHINIKIIKISNNNSEIIIKPIVGEKLKIMELVTTLSESIILYNSCPYVRYFIENE